MTIVTKLSLIVCIKTYDTGVAKELKYFEQYRAWHPAVGLPTQQRRQVSSWIND